jgi:hypothetical protein
MTTSHETLATVLARRWGVATTVNISPASAQLNSQSSQLFKQNPNRLAWILVNLSTTDVFVTPLFRATATRGIRVPSNGGFMSLLADEDLDMVGYEWFAIASLDLSPIFWLEVLTNPMQAVS